MHDDVFRRVRSAFANDHRLVAVFGSYDDRVATSCVVAGSWNVLHHCVHQRSAGAAATFSEAQCGPARRVRSFRKLRRRAVSQPSIEDIELGGRLATRGKVTLDPALHGTRLKESILASMVGTDFRRRGSPWMLLLLERRQLPATLNLGTIGD